MAIRKNQRYENLKATVMLGDQYAKDQTQEEYESNQALLEEQFEHMGNVYDIYEELVRGSNIYTNVRAGVSPVKSISSTSRVDDFKTLLFKRVNHKVFIGKRYKFENNYWITINSSKINTLMNETLVQRCNNTLKWYDYDLDIIYEEPCIVGDKITSTVTEEQTHISVIEGTLSVVLQYNDISKKLKINDRFILNGNAYTVRMIDKSRREETMDKDSVGNIYLELDVSEINPYTDDLENNIAYILVEEEDKIEDKLNGDILTPSDINELFVFAPYNTQTYEVYNYIDDVKQGDTFEFKFYDALLSKYEVIGITSNSFTVKCLDFSNVPLVVEYRNLVSGEINEFIIKLSGVL